MEKYILYSRGTKGGGAVISSTASGGGSSQTSSSGGGLATSTSSGGGSSQTSSSGGEHRHAMFLFNSDTGTKDSSSLSQNFSSFYAQGDRDGGSASLVQMQGWPDDLYTYSADGNHSHSVNIPNHAHDFNVPNHSHNVPIPAHTHDITLPDHTHEIDYGIFELDELPTAVKIEVDGTVIPHTAINGERIDLIPYLLKDADGKIQRNRWVEIKITPNSLARINASVTSRLFVQSRIGGTY